MLKELRNQHRTIIQMVFSGYKNKEIAERLEMSDATVSQIVRSPLGQAYLEGLQDKAKESTLDVRKKLVSMNSSALSVLERIMNPAEKASHAVQLTAAKDVLDRTGYKAPDRLHVDMTMQTKTDQEIDAEITAMQQSINKTYLKSPGTSFTAINIAPEGTEDNDQTIQYQEAHSNSKTVQKIENTLFTIEQQELEREYELAPETVDNKEMDSSDDFVSNQKTIHHKNLLADDKNPINSLTSSSISEESISLLSKIPTNLFCV